MKSGRRKQIGDILKNFDFDYVCEVMRREAPQWGYSRDRQPQVKILKNIASDLLKDVVDDKKRHALSMTHGLLAMKWGDCLSLYFVPVMWEME